MARPAHGFVATMDLSEWCMADSVRAVHDAGVSHVTGDGIEIVTRPYACTAESVGEAQPLFVDGCLLAYEGRVDNRNALAQLLGAPAIASASDGVVLAAAYAAWGPLLSARVIGEYAYLVIDPRTRRVVAGQDSLGVRRLYYGRHGRRAFITSNLRLLFERFPEMRPPFDRDALREYFAGTMSPWSGCTIWRGIRELGRGKVLVQADARLEERIAWEPDGTRRTAAMSREEVDESFRTLLVDAVRGALRAPGPILCDLSGGYDSSAICAIAASLTRGGATPLVAWSYFNERSDERALQEAIRASCGVEMQALDIRRHLPFQAFDDAPLPSGGFIQFGAIDREMRGFAATHGLTTRLTGYAADALLGKGTPAPVYLSEWLRQGRIGDWCRDVAAYVRSGAFSVWHLVRDCSVGTLDMHAGTVRFPEPDWLMPAFRDEIRQANHDFLHPPRRLFASQARERLYRATLCFIPQHGRMLPDERMPFVHRPLVEFILALDWKHLVRPGEDRPLMRRALGGVLPAAVLAGGKSPHGASILEGLRAAWPKISRLLTGEHLAALGVVDAQRFRAALETMRAGYSGPNRQFANTALYLEMWLSLQAHPHNATV